MTIEDGGRVINGDGYVGYDTFTYGTGTVTVGGANPGTGEASTWNNNGDLYVGYLSEGVLTIERGGIVRANQVTVGSTLSSEGTIELLGDAVSGRGVLETGMINTGNGTAALILNGGILRATANGSFINGFSTLAVGDNGAWFDTNGHTIAVNTAFTSGPLGSFNKLGAGTLTLTGASSIGGNVTANGGTLAITNGGTVSDYYGFIGDAVDSIGEVKVTGLGSAWTNTSHLYIGLDGNGTLRIEDKASVSNAAGTIAMNLGSTGTVTVSGAGSTWSNTQTLYVGEGGQGFLTVEGGGKASAVGVALGTSANSEGTATVSGMGSTLTTTSGLVVGNNGKGTLTIANQGEVSGTAATVGFFTDSSGTINIGAAADGSATTAGVLNVQSLDFRDGDGTLVFNHNNTNYVFSADLLSNGGGAHVIDHIAGTTLLTGDSSGFDGSTTVSGGTLMVGDHSGTGSLGGTIDVLSGGTLGGSGAVGTTTVASGGTIAPGNSIGTLNVVGDYMQKAGSTYVAEIDPAGNSDLIKVTGKATIEGGTVFALKAPGGYSVGTRYTILTATGGVFGSYRALTQNAPFADLTLAYDPGNVYLAVSRNGVSFCDVAITLNQCSTAKGAASAGSGNPIYDAIAGLPDASSARIAFDALSGEVHALAKGALIQDSRFIRDVINDRIRAAFTGVGAAQMPVLAYGETGSGNAATAAIGNALAPADTERLAAWGSVFGSRGSTDGDGNAASLDRSTGGFITGLDGFVAENWRLGIMTGYSHSSFDVDDRASSGSSDNYHLGLYSGTQMGALGFRSGIAYTWHKVSTGRSVAFPGFTDSLSGDYDAGTTQTFGELGYQINTARASFEPFANLAYVNLHTDSFAEKGGAAALTSAGKTTDTSFTTLGVRASTDFDLGTTKATARGMIGWRHAFGDTVPTSTHAFAGSDAFIVTGAPIAKDSAVIEAGLDFAISRNATLGISYTGQFGSGARENGAKADLSVRF